ncbi:unnamed protein product [Diplocarpon coronariae]
MRATGEPRGEGTTSPVPCERLQLKSDHLIWLWAGKQGKLGKERTAGETRDSADVQDHGDDDARVGSEPRGVWILGMHISHRPMPYHPRAYLTMYLDSCIGIGLGIGLGLGLGLAAGVERGGSRRAAGLCVAVYSRVPR